MEPLIAELIRFIEKNADKDTGAIALAKIPDHLKTEENLHKAVLDKLLLQSRRKFCYRAVVDPAWEKNPKGPVRYLPGHDVSGTRDELYRKGELFTWDGAKNEEVPAPPPPAFQRVCIESGWEEWKEIKGTNARLAVRKLLSTEAAQAACDDYPAEAMCHLMLTDAGFQAARQKAQPAALAGAK